MCPEYKVHQDNTEGTVGHLYLLLKLIEKKMFSNILCSDITEHNCGWKVKDLIPVVVVRLL